MQKGIQNEQEFKKIIDGKKVGELPKNIQELIKSIFINIDNYSVVECWQSKYVEKADIKLKINNMTKGISIKSGIFCSMHQEDINKFSKFMLRIGVDEITENYFRRFIYGEINGKRVTAKEYISFYTKEIDQIKRIFNNYYIKINLIIRFLFQGTEIHRYGCDAIIYGTPLNFIWATKAEILKYLLEHTTTHTDFINIGLLNIKCYDRNLRNNPSKVKGQNEIQVKWYTIKDDILYITMMREANKIINNQKYDNFNT